MNSVLIGIPTLNEAKNVPLMVKRLLKIPLAADILFIDDQSTDSTGELLDSLANEHPSIRVIHRGPCMGIGSAHRDILRYAYNKGYDSLITMDCDLGNPEIPRQIRFITNSVARRRSILPSRSNQ